MYSPNQVVGFQFSNVIKSILMSLLLLSSFWAFFLGLNWLGVNFPAVSTNRFFDFGIFSLSTFSFITFLTMIPIQTTEAKLSPGFYARLIHSVWTHFGLYVIVMCSIVSVAVELLPPNAFVQNHLCELYLANLSSIIFAIVFHRSWVLRNLYQPYLVYSHIEKLSKEESKQELWIEVYEIAYKALKDGRLGNAKEFISILAYIFYHNEKVQRAHFDDDLRSLYKVAEDVHPAARHLEEKFPFLRSEKNIKEHSLLERMEPALMRIR